MVVSVKHIKTNNVADWTQEQLNSVVNGGAAPLPPIGTQLDDIVLPSDWNDDHVIDTTGASDGDVLTVVAGVAEWAASGGGGSPAGSNTQVQFNDGGAFGADAGLVYNKTTDTLTSGMLSLLSTTAASSTTTGSLINSGGFGNAGAAYIGGLANIAGQILNLRHSSNNPVMRFFESSTTQSAAIETFNNELYFSLSSSNASKNIYMRNTAGFGSTSKLQIDFATASTSTTTGALTVAGGVGVAGAGVVGQGLLLSSVNSGLRVEGAVFPTGTGAGFEAGYSSGGSTSFFQSYNRTTSAFAPLSISASVTNITQGVVNITNSTASTTSANGALVVTGGLGVGGAINAGGAIAGSNLSGTNTGDQNLFRTIAVSGQSDVVADSTTDTLTLVAGTNITITTDAATDSITINSTGGGGGGSVNSASGQVDFGFPSGQEGDIAVVTITAAWANSANPIICNLIATATADHDPEDYALEGITAYATNIVNGVGFDIIARAPFGTWGRYNVNAIGV